MKEGKPCKGRLIFLQVKTSNDAIPTFVSICDEEERLVAFFLIVVFLLNAFAQSKSFTERLMQDSCAFASTGRNLCFILEPGYQQSLQGVEGKREHYTRHHRFKQNNLSRSLLSSVAIRRKNHTKVLCDLRVLVASWFNSVP